MLLSGCIYKWHFILYILLFHNRYYEWSNILATMVGGMYFSCTTCMKDLLQSSSSWQLLFPPLVCWEAKPRQWIGSSWESYVATRGTAWRWISAPSYDKYILVGSGILQGHRKMKSCRGATTVTTTFGYLINRQWNIAIVQIVHTRCEFTFKH